MSTDDSTQNGAPGEGERIAKVLSRAGIASRRDAERLVLEGRVTVNGDKITSPATNVTPKDRLDGGRPARGRGRGPRASGSTTSPRAS
jgi:23S rRNA pseudouridine2605 synthase